MRAYTSAGAKRTRELLDEMTLVVPWIELVSLIAKHASAPLVLRKICIIA